MNNFGGIGDIRYDELILWLSPGMTQKHIINFLHFSATGFVWVYGNDAMSHVGSDKIVKKSECGTLEGGKLLSLF